MMEMDYTDEKITFDKVLNSLDEFVLDFVAVLDKLGIKYVLISGYVAILFGRSRASEDIDMFIEKLDPATFAFLWDELQERFECINAGSADSAYKDYLKDGLAIRFSRQGLYIPNMEIKFPKTELDSWSLANKRRVVLNGHEFHISPIELQIAFKLSMGSEKDIEDARHLYNLFKDKLDRNMFMGFVRKLNIEKERQAYLV